MSLKGLFSKIKATRTTQNNDRHIEGTQTQFPNAEPTNRKQLIIGLDFGTAFTKVVVSDSVDKIAIPLRQQESGIDQYLLPTLLWVTNDGACSIDETMGFRCADLKMSLLFSRVSVDAVLKASAYLALVLRKIRFYLLNNKSELYGGYHIDWYINIGVPTDSYHDLEFIDLYKSIIRRAWGASCKSGDITFDHLKNILKASHDSGGDDDCHINDEAVEVIPEFVAQVTGYVRSTLRQDDLHLLVDVGAGTLDATVFNVHQVEGEDKFPIFAKSVEHLGTRFLTEARLAGSDHDEEGVFDPYAPLPSNRLAAETLGVSMQKLKDIDAPFKAKIRKQILALLKYTKERRYPESRRWINGLPIFLCGGGGKSEFYKSFFISKDGQIGPYRTQVRRLPELDDLDVDELDASDFDRLSVAYGLSFDALDIGDIIRQDEVEDVLADESANDMKKGGISCPRCQGTGGLYSTCLVCGGSGLKK